MENNDHYTLKEVFEKEIKRLDKAIEDTLKVKADKERVDSAHKFAVISLILTGILIIFTIIHLFL